MVRNPPASAGDIRDAGSILGSGRSLEEVTATHSSILARRIPLTEEPGGLQYTGSQKSDMSDGLTLLLTCTQGYGGLGRVAIYLCKSSA